MPQEPRGDNPFGSPTADLGGRIPYDGSPAEAAHLRSLYLSRETTLRAMGVTKLATVAACLLGGFVFLVASQAAPIEQLLDGLELNLSWTNQAHWVSAAVFLALGLFHVAIAVGLWYLHGWARWMQAISSMLMGLAALAILAQSLGGDLSVVLFVFSGMLLGSVHAIVLFLVLSHPAGQITTEEHADIRRLTSNVAVNRIIAFKAGLLLVIWFAGALAIVGSFAM